ncbi:EamA family transporter RarD [Halocynthiibacter sp.]|uniref:EamA family transporter RarD n=1 Tax=Halocynthiibacter sp. TaxID=1979210 RepID=UPI003C3F3524
MSETFKGVAAMVLACVIWGLSPLFYKALAHVPPLEVLSHRTLWSFVLFIGLMLIQKRMGEFLRLFTSARVVVLILIAALLISTNWGLFIWSIQVGRAVESSLGYYIFPLVAVLLGAVIFRERLSAVQWFCVGLAAVAVITLTIGLRVVPLVSLALAITFGFYGVLKKRLEAGPVISVAAEVAVLLPLALIWLYGVHALGWQGLVGRNLGVFGADQTDTLLLILSGAVTAVPLILFSYASRRAPLSIVGLVQYLNPTLQGAIAIFVFQEAFTIWHMIAFALIWSALALFSFDTLRKGSKTG